MLMHNTLDTLRSLKLHGLATALEEQQALPQTHALPFEERLSLLVDHCERSASTATTCAKRPGSCSRHTSKSRRPASRTSTTKPRGESTSARSQRSPRATRSGAARTS